MITAPDIPERDATVVAFASASAPTRSVNEPAWMDDSSNPDTTTSGANPAVRNNRAALLQQLGTLMNRVADISKLAA